MFAMTNFIESKIYFMTPIIMLKKLWSQVSIDTLSHGQSIDPLFFNYRFFLLRPFQGVFRRAHDINNGVIIRFFAPAKNTSFMVDIMGPINRPAHARFVVSTRRHMFTTDVT